MIECAVVAVRRNAFRFALTGIVAIWLSGCSADSSRFADGGNPFTNPFSTASIDAAPTPRVAARPANGAYATATHPSPVSVAALPTPAPESSSQIRTASAPVGGSAVGWSAVGGSPIVVGSSDDADTLSRRYGVPTAALLSANGMHAKGDLHSGMHIVVPVYNAHGHAVAETEADKPERRKVADADENTRKSDKAKRRKSKDDGADADSSDSDKTHRKSAKADKDTSDREARAERVKKDGTDKAEKKDKLAKAEKSESGEKIAKADKTEKVAKAEAPKSDRKKAAADMTETGALTSATAAKDESSKQADAAGASPEFRWPARGRIIQGFKTGGNEGINIAVPEGTSVRAAEDGKVAYAGSALKGYGNLVLIRHPNGFVTAYANNGELSVKSGETVKRGQVIAKSGQTGDVNSPQLHFELRKGQTPVDPTSYLAGL